MAKTLANCKYCGKPLSYLPFTCKYCGNSFCKEHRLPENHDCQGDFKQPVYQKFSQPPQEAARERTMYKDADDVLSGKKKVKIRARREPRTSGRGNYGATWGGPSNRNISYAPYFIITTVVLTLIAMFWVQFGFWVRLSAGSLINNFYFHTILTSLFLSNNSGFFGLIFLIIIAFFMFQLGKMLELRFGSKFFLSMWLVCGLLTGVVFLGLQSLFALIPESSDLGSLILFYGTGCVTGVFYGMIAFMVSINPEGQANIIIFIMPVRMKLKWILYVLYAFTLGLGMIYFIIGVVEPNTLTGVSYLAIAASNLSPLGGILGGKLMYRNTGGARQAPQAVVQWGY